MALRCIILLCLLTIVRTDTPSNQPKVHEAVDEEPTLTPDIGVVRVARHPKLLQRQNPSSFDYTSIIQQDPQKIRYAQQQEVDSYVQAYQLEQQSKRPIKSRKQSKQLPANSIPTSTAGQYPRQAHNASTKSETIRASLKQNNVNVYPGDDTLSDQQLKVVDPEYEGRNTGDEKLQKVRKSDNQKLSAAREEKVLGYQVGEDQDTESTDKLESRVFVGQEDVLKNVQYGTPLSANYLAKPMYVLANPQLQLDPKIFAQGLQFSLPENHQLRAEGFETASKSDLDALSALLGKAPSDQLQGLNHLLGQQVENLQDSFPVLPQKQSLVDFKGLTPHSEALIGLKDYTQQSQQLVDLKSLIPEAEPNVGLTDLIQQTQPSLALQDLVQQPQTITGFKDFVQQAPPRLALQDLVQQPQAIAGFKDFVQQAQPNLALQDLVQQAQPSSALQDLVQQPQTIAGFKDFVQQSQTGAGFKDLVQTPTAAGLKDLVQQPQVLIQSASDVGSRTHTPIKEEVLDFANTQTKPNIKTQVPQVNTKTQQYIDQQLELARESKSIYGKNHNNLQYAAQYAFGYRIRDYHSGNDFGHEEIREGDVAKGHYHVLLPDGRLQNVEYYADPTGYHAKVTYSTVEQHN